MSKTLTFHLLVLTLLVACGDDTEPARIESEAPVEGAGEAPAGGRQTIQFDQDDGRVTWSARKVTRQHEGGFRTFSGSIELDPQELTRSSVSVDIVTDSIFADVDRLTTHLKSDDFFDVGRFPRATFRSTGIRAGGEGGATHTITGNLEMHGVSRSISFPATLAVTDGEVTARAQFQINRQEWGIAYPGMPDDLVADNVGIGLDIRAPRR